MRRIAGRPYFRDVPGGQLNKTQLANDLRRFGRILLFRATPEETERMSWRLLLIGITSTWLVGIGRWWDDPRPEIPIFVRWGLGSVVYVFGLSTLLWLFALPLVKTRITFKQMLVFIACTSPPAIIYAVPIELWVDSKAARTYNFAALCLVAAYRVSLLAWFMRRIGRLTGDQVLLICATPILLIIAVVTQLGFESRVMDIMGGHREGPRPTIVDGLLYLISMTGIYLAPVALIAYIVAVFSKPKDFVLMSQVLRWRQNGEWHEMLISRVTAIVVRKENGMPSVEIRQFVLQPARIGSDMHGFDEYCRYLEKQFNLEEGSIKKALEALSDNEELIFTVQHGKPQTD